MRCCEPIVWLWCCHVHVETWLSWGNYIFDTKCHFYTSPSAYYLNVLGQRFGCRVVHSSFHSCLCGVSEFVSGLGAIGIDQFQNVTGDSNLFANERAMLFEYLYIQPYFNTLTLWLIVLLCAKWVTWSKYTYNKLKAIQWHVCATHTLQHTVRMKTVLLRLQWGVLIIHVLYMVHTSCICKQDWTI